MKKKLLILLFVISFLGCTSEHEARNTYADKLELYRVSLVTFALNCYSTMDYHRKFPSDDSKMKFLVADNERFLRTIKKDAPVIDHKYDDEEMNIRFLKLNRSLRSMNDLIGDCIQCNYPVGSNVDIYISALYNELSELEYEIIRFRAKK